MFEKHREDSENSIIEDLNFFDRIHKATAEVRRSPISAASWVVTLCSELDLLEQNPNSPWSHIVAYSAALNEFANKCGQADLIYRMQKAEGTKDQNTTTSRIFRNLATIAMRWTSAPIRAYGLHKAGKDYLALLRRIALLCDWDVFVDVANLVLFQRHYESFINSSTRKSTLAVNVHAPHTCLLMRSELDVILFRLQKEPVNEIPEIPTIVMKWWQDAQMLHSHFPTDEAKARFIQKDELGLIKHGSHEQWTFTDSSQQSTPTAIESRGRKRTNPVPAMGLSPGSLRIIQNKK